MSDGLKRAQQNKVVSAQYLGGHPLDTRQRRVTLKLTPLALAFGKITIDLEDIVSTQVESAGEINKRITVTRIFAVGVFALALPKKNDNRHKYLSVEFVDDQGNHHYGDDSLTPNLEADSLNSVIKAGDEQAKEILIELLKGNEEYSSEAIEMLMNSGDDELSVSANGWANRNGYLVVKRNPRATSATWGSGRK